MMAKNCLDPIRRPDCNCQDNGAVSGVVNSAAAANVLSKLESTCCGIASQNSMLQLSVWAEIISSKTGNRWRSYATVTILWARQRHGNMFPRDSSSIRLVSGHACVLRLCMQEMSSSDLGQRLTRDGTSPRLNSVVGACIRRVERSGAPSATRANMGRSSNTALTLISARARVGSSAISLREIAFARVKVEILGLGEGHQKLLGCEGLAHMKISDALRAKGVGARLGVASSSTRTCRCIEAITASLAICGPSVESAVTSAILLEVDQRPGE